jgi:hypothetical protein
MITLESRSKSACLKLKFKLIILVFFKTDLIRQQRNKSQENTGNSISIFWGHLGRFSGSGAWVTANYPYESRTDKGVKDWGTHTKMAVPISAPYDGEAWSRQVKSSQVTCFRMPYERHVFKEGKRRKQNDIVCLAWLDLTSEFSNLWPAANQTGSEAGAAHTGFSRLIQSFDWVGRAIQRRLLCQWTIEALAQRSFKSMGQKLIKARFFLNIGINPGQGTVLFWV